MQKQLSFSETLSAAASQYSSTSAVQNAASSSGLSQQIIDQAKCQQSTTIVQIIGEFLEGKQKQKQVVEAQYNNFGISIANFERFKDTKEKPSTKISRKWSKFETKKFYQLLKRYSMNFSIMSQDQQFKGKRSQKQLRNKYRKESKSNQAFIDELLTIQTIKTKQFQIISNSNINYNSNIFKDIQIISKQKILTKTKTIDTNTQSSSTTTQSN